MYMVGTNSFNVTSANDQYAKVEKIYVHPNYSHAAYDWDLALVKLTHPLLFTDYVRPVCVPGAEMAPIFNADTLTTVTGWGAIYEGGKFYQNNLELKNVFIAFVCDQPREVPFATSVA